MRRGSKRRRLADGLARAFLSGPWNVGALITRGADALGGLHRVLPPLARAARRGFPEAPALEALSDFLAGRAALGKAVAADADRTLRIVRWFPGPTPVGRRTPSLSHLVLPDIADVPSLASFLEVKDTQLEWLADLKRINRRAPDPRLWNYRYTWIAKRSGAFRLIEAPKPTLARVQRQILRAILDQVPPHVAAHAFRRGRSVKSFVAPHAGKRVVVRMDLAEFFVSIRERRVRALFTALGYAAPVARRLAAICCTATPERVLFERPLPEWATDSGAANADRMRLRTPHLPQGAPSSPAIANLVAQRLDVRLTGLASAFDATYTRYADDLAFSGGEDLDRRVQTFVARAGAIAIEEGFDVRFRKTRVMRASRRQELASVVVNRAPTLRRAELERLEAILYNCVRRGPSVENREAHPDLRAHLAGKLSWAANIAPHRTARLSSLYAAIDWSR